MRNPEKYTYRIRWSEEDQEHVATCDEFPSLSWLASSPVHALEEAIKLVGRVLLDMRRGGEVAPVPHTTQCTPSPSPPDDTSSRPNDSTILRTYVVEKLAQLRRTPLAFAVTQEAFAAQALILLDLVGVDSRRLLAKHFGEPGLCSVDLGKLVALVEPAWAYALIDEAYALLEKP